VTAVPAPALHLIVRRWRAIRSTGVHWGAECSCGEMITGPSPKSRDASVNYHLANADGASEGGAR
jgi:hypothetical protein